MEEHQANTEPGSTGSTVKPDRAHSPRSPLHLYIADQTGNGSIRNELSQSARDDRKAKPGLN